MGALPARGFVGVGLAKFALSAGRLPARRMGAGLAARQLVQPAWLSAPPSVPVMPSASFSAFGPWAASLPPISAGVGLGRLALSLAGSQPG